MKKQRSDLSWTWKWAFCRMRCVPKLLKRLFSGYVSDGWDEHRLFWSIHLFGKDSNRVWSVCERNLERSGRRVISTNTLPRISFQIVHLERTVLKVLVMLTCNVSDSRRWVDDIRKQKFDLSVRVWNGHYVIIKRGT